MTHEPFTRPANPRVQNCARKLDILGEVWTATRRRPAALCRMLRAEVVTDRSGPDLLGAVIRAGTRHFIFLNDRLIPHNPGLYQVVLAHEASHIVRGVRSLACCRPFVTDPEELATWHATGQILIPRRYGRAYLYGQSVGAIMERWPDPIVGADQIRWRAAIEIVEGRWPGDPVAATAEADELVQSGLRGLARKVCALYGGTMSAAVPFDWRSVVASGLTLALVELSCRLTGKTLQSAFQAVQLVSAVTS